MMNYRFHTGLFWVALATMTACTRYEYRPLYVYDRTLVKARPVHPSVTPPPQVQAKKMKMPQQDQEDPPGDSPVDALEAIEEANSQATDRSSRQDFVLSTQYFDYVPGQIYEVVASPGFITSLMLKPGEKLTSIAAGDTHRWQVQQTSIGSQPRQGLVLVKPHREWIDTNLVLTTDRRVYQISLKSVPGGVYNATVAWRYASDAMVEHVEPPGGTDTPGPLDIPPTRMPYLDFEYTITHTMGRYPPPKWMPTKVFNDGKKTYIRFPDDFTAAPTLHLSSPTGIEMVNYRVHGRFYIVDKVIERAELRLNRSSGYVVRITHRNAGQVRPRGERWFGN